MCEKRADQIPEDENETDVIEEEKQADEDSDESDQWEREKEDD
jgi:hypothetical protein